MNLDELEKKIELTDKKVDEYKWKKPRRATALEKKSDKKFDHVLVEYLTARYMVRRLLVKVVAGNLAVIDNKVHILNPRDVWRDGKYMWYKIREIDRLPISNRDYDKMIRQKRMTINDSVVIKAIVGAIEKKEPPKIATKWLLYIVIGVVVIGAIYLIFFSK